MIDVEVRRDETGKISSIVQYEDDLKKFTGMDLMRELSGNYAKETITYSGPHQISLRTATIIKNVSRIHNKSKGERDNECIIELFRMVNECGLFWGQVSDKVAQQDRKIPRNRVTNEVAGFSYPPNILSEYFDYILTKGRENFSEGENRDFLYIIFDEAFRRGLENTKVKLAEKDINILYQRILNEPGLVDELRGYNKKY